MYNTELVCDLSITRFRKQYRKLLYSPNDQFIVYRRSPINGAYSFSSKNDCILIFKARYIQSGVPLGILFSKNYRILFFIY